MRAMPVAVTIAALILIPSALPVASSFFPVASNSYFSNATAAAPVGSVPKPQMLDVCGRAEFLWRHSAPTAVWPNPAAQTAELRAAIWTATAVIAAASIAVAAASDQAHRYRRPARSGSKRWAAGWAGRAGHGRPVTVE